jgi:hypothetical protein
MSLYNTAFYDAQSDISYASALKVVPILVDLLTPRSVIDVGCGVGTWLSVFESCGVSISGAEGPWVVSQSLRIHKKHIDVVDLNSSFNLEKKFDCAISLEVAEHLDSDRGEGFVADICKLSDTIVFGAAIPGQGGTDHRNERPQSYWVSLFRKHGFVVFDAVRPVIWNDEQIGPAYRQNILVYALEGSTAHQRLLGKNIFTSAIYDIVHPCILKRQADRTRLFEKSRVLNYISALKRLVNSKNV